MHYFIRKKKCSVGEDYSYNVYSSNADASEVEMRGLAFTLKEAFDIIDIVKNIKYK